MKILNKKQLNKLTDEELRLYEWELERHKVKTDLMYLCKNYLVYLDLNEGLHREVISAVRKIKKFKTMVFHLPRGHLKTSLLAHGWVIQQILNNPDIRIAILTSSHDKAVDINRIIQQHLCSKKLVALFPEVLSEQPKKSGYIWREEGFIVKRSSIVEGFTLRVTTIDSEITGQHFDIMLFDDIQGEKNSQTLLMIRKLIKSFKNCLSVLEPGGLRIVLGTRWNKEDFYGWFAGKGQHWTMTRSATVLHGKSCSLETPGASVIFPEKFSIPILKELKAEQGAYFYSAQYENNPIPEEDMVFGESCIRYYEGEEPTFERIYILVDPALSLNRDADESVISVVGQPEDEDLPLYCLKSKGMSFSETSGKIDKVIDAIFNEYVYQSRKKAVVVVGIETAAFQHVLKQWIEKEQKKRKLFFPITELKHGGRKKESRIQALQPLFENDGILLHPDRCKGLVSQLLDYTSTALHDDHPDALAYLLDVLVEDAFVDVLETGGNDEYYDPYSAEALIARMEGGGEPRSYLDY